MDIVMIVIAVVFGVLVVIGGVHLLQEPPAPGKKKSGKKEPAAPKRDGKADFVRILQKKVAIGEEKIKELEGEFQVQRQELSKAKEREKKLLDDKKSMEHDARSYQKFKKEHKILRDEAAKKEHLLEDEISRRRQQTTQLANVKSDIDALKKELKLAQDNFRKTQALYERTVGDLKETRAALNKITKAAQAEAGQKTQGGWIAKEEFDKVEHELQEKEALLKKLLTLQQQPPPPTNESS